MDSRTCASKGITLKGVLASALALLAFVICMPQLAFAEEATQIIDGTMTITVQGGSSGGGASGAGVSSVIPTSATTTSGSISSNVLTGDMLIWLILGIVVLLAGAIYVFIKSRRLVSAGSSVGALAEDPTSTKRKTIIVAVVTALIACVCFGMFASKSSAFAKEGTNSIVGTSSVVVDNQGNVISSDLAINNNSGGAVFINSIQAPNELEDWNASIKDETIQSGSFTQGFWDGKTISATLLEKIKNSSNSSIDLTFKISINKALDFDQFSLDTENLSYTGKQITPEVTSSAYEQGRDFEVVYGENKNAGEGSITIKGIGGYQGEKTYTFTTIKADPQYSVPQDIVAEVGQILLNVKLPEQTEPVAGKFSWKEPTMSVGGIGKHDFKATFTPKDTNNYNVVKNIEITVEVTNPKTAFAVYSKTDNSLNFYKRTEVPTEGSTFENKEATAVYENIETDRYTTSLAPWSSQFITNATVIDDGIHPVSTARWFLSSYYTSLESPIEKADFS